ncbi:MAG: hypothetical protein D6712_03940 [Chloroflexi bacterium]|nr:MAG: hypothetical protein D6712_03940 [Chloroflexota bacterium]
MFVSLVASLQTIAALLLVAFGVIALIQPARLAQMAGLDASSTNGKAEIRISWGGLYIGLGLGAMLIGTSEAFRLLGIAHIALALTRAVLATMNRDIVNRGYQISLAWEIIMGVVFMLPR